MAQKKVISRPENLEAFDQERDILRALAGDRHAHIVKLIDSHIDEGPQGTASEPVLDDDYDNESVISSYAASVISVQSLASSATDLSNGSGYSAHQIATATKELVTIFQEDDLLKPLYKRAINDDSIGPEKLERNLRRLFKQYAEHLKGEATDGLEYLAARLVTLKARFLAQSIVQSFKCNDRPKAREKIPKEESSDEEEESQTVDDAMFDDLIIFREFLVGSDAFQRLKAQIQSFVLPKVTLMAEGKETHTIVPVKDISTMLASRYLSTQAAEGNEPPYQSSATSELMSRISSRYERANWSIYWRLRRTWEAFLVVSGCLEPPLEPGKVRLRWRCKCGDSFSGDFTEYKEDGIAELASDMLRATGTEVTITTHSSSSSNQKYMGQHPGLWIRNALVRLTTTFRKPAKQYTLPQHNSANVTCCPAPSPNPPPNKMLHLFSCMHAGRFRKSLTQDRIDSIDTDRNLFCFLREQFRLHRGRFVTLLSLKAVQGIYFIKFRLPMGGSVEVRPHNPCCIIPQSCECIPPAHRVEPKGTEYRCIPGPPPVWPPIDPHYLAHLFTTPSCINENDTWILDQLPKRICGELQGKAGQPAEGWGIYYLESWDRDVITLLLVTLFLLMSLVFGVLWSCLKMDVQGAFGVSAYMMAACAVLVGLVTMKVDKV
ncbi:hypothetical protein CC80DRAFT_423899 [Byssothecium circinans]|uniref:Uncharacterized protein n=1 Tax=Byssothecium circinans TaxID=147558 RepID=A0A6A5TGN4_9PLEO|nr:hypothetical protein CC80DRAFT_423899 [Byssothecium circinans]